MNDLRPDRLYLIPLSATTLPAAMGSLDMITVCYLVQMSDGTNILIDTGLPADYAPQPGMPAPHYETNVIAQLATLGLQPDDIDILICTHFDVDHAGYHDAFTHAKLVVQREHYELARSGHPRYAAARPHWDHPTLNYRFVDGDTELFDGITLIKTGGHAPAHQSVLVRLPETGNVILAIDAVVMQRLFTVERRAWPTDDNEAELRESTQKLLDLVMRKQVGLVVFGHDGAQWKTLSVAPAYYS